VVLLAVGCASPGGVDGIGGGGGSLKNDLGGHVESFDLASELPDLTAPADPSVAKDLSVVVDLASPADLSMTPDLSGVMLPANGGATCATAPVLPEGIVVPNQDTTGQANTYDYGVSTSSACSTPLAYTYDGPDVSYAFTIPAGKTLKVTVTPSGGWDAAVGIVTNCAKPGSSCLAGSDNLSGAEIAQHKNSGTSPLDVFIIVDSYLPSEYGKFTIRADVL
jgi:hypothetical protein